MTAFNDVTGDPLRTKVASEKFRNNYDLIFGKKDKKEEQKPSEDQVKTDDK